MLEYVNINESSFTGITDSQQLWKIDGSGEDRSVTYLSTLAKHTQAVNVVRWCPKGISLSYSVVLNTRSNN